MVTAFGPTQQEREALLEGARRIAPQIRDAADEIEAGRQLPDHVVQLLREAGAFRMIQPKAWGGHDADPVTQILFIEEIAKADASAAWCVMIGCDGGLLSRELDEDVAREMYADIDAVTCGAAFPPGQGRARRGRLPRHRPLALSQRDHPCRLGPADLQGRRRSDRRRRGAALLRALGRAAPRGDGARHLAHDRDARQRQLRHRSERSVRAERALHPPTRQRRTPGRRPAAPPGLAAAQTHGRAAGRRSRGAR